MTSRDFAFWLQGYFEIHGGSELSPAQVDLIKRHLALVFRHEIDPQEPVLLAQMRAVHDGAPAPPDVGPPPCPPPPPPMC